MSNIIHRLHDHVHQSDSIVGFDHTDHERFLTLEGENAYHIGIHCDTCGFFFERLDGANKGDITSKEISQELKRGLTGLDKTFLNKVKPITPKGEYITSLLR